MGVNFFFIFFTCKLIYIKFVRQNSFVQLVFSLLFHPKCSVFTLSLNRYRVEPFDSTVQMCSSYTIK